MFPIEDRTGGQMDTKGYIHCQHGIPVMRSGLESGGQQPLMEMIDPYPCAELGCRATFRKAMNTQVDGVPFQEGLTQHLRSDLAQQREEIPLILLEAAARSMLTTPTTRSLANAIEIVRPIVAATLRGLADYAEQITLLSCDRTSGPNLRILAERVEGAEL